MLKLKYIGLKTEYDVEFSNLTKNIVQIKGTLPAKTNGFTLSRAGKDDNWDYSGYKTIYRELDGVIQFSNDGSVYVKPVPTVRFAVNDAHGTLSGEVTQKVESYEDLIVPTVEAAENYEFAGWSPEIPTEGEITSDKTFTAVMVYVPTLEEVQEAKVEEMNAIQQQIIQLGIDVTLTNGGVENFTLTDHDQTSIMGLQTLVAQGEESIPWHTSDQAEHCKYYSNADMALITAAAMQFVTFHVTYFRDLRIYIRSMGTKEEVQAVIYGVSIPEAYQSEPLKDMYAVMQEG